MKNPQQAAPARRRLIIPRVCSLAGGLLLSAFPANGEVKLTFDTDTQGFTAGWDATSMTHSSAFGGSLEVVAGFGWKPAGAIISLNASPALKAELESAIAGGSGYIKYTIHVQQSGISGANPNWFEGICIGNSQANPPTNWDQHVGQAQGVYGLYGGNFPLADTYSTTVTLPIVAVGLAGATPGNTSLEFMPDSTYNEIIIGLNSDNSGAFTAGKFYIDDFTINAGALPAGAVYTFDVTKDGFTRDGTGNPDNAYSPDFGGSLALLPAAVDNTAYSHRAARFGVGGDQLNKLQRIATEGGSISFDLIADAGILGTFGLSQIVQPHNVWTWCQANAAFAFGSVQPLPGGKEIARVVIPYSAYSPGFPVQSNYSIFLAYGGAASSPVVHLDNWMFLPTGGAVAKLPFDDTVQNLAATAAATSLEAVGGSVVLTDPTGMIWGADAVFTGTDPDAQVAAVHGNLALAATKGGTLKLKVQGAVLTGRTEDFAGVDVIVALGGTPRQEFYPLYIPASDFTEGGSAPGEEPVVLADSTGPTFTRTISIPLYPQGSTETDGMVLEQGATQYAFQIGTQTADTGAVSVTLDDFEVVVKAELEIIHTPALVSSAGGFVGRLLTNGGTEAVYSATGLPPGITIDPMTGLISGIPTLDGTYNVVFSVTEDGVTVSTDSAEWIVATSVIPTITSFSSAGGTAIIVWAGTGTTPVNVERSTTLVGSWDVISTGDTDGTHTDASPPLGKAFYRIVAP